jgi:hypothetical protein
MPGGQDAHASRILDDCLFLGLELGGLLVFLGRQRLAGEEAEPHLVVLRRGIEGREPVQELGEQRERSGCRQVAARTSANAAPSGAADAIGDQVEYR